MRASCTRETKSLPRCSGEAASRSAKNASNGRPFLDGNQTPSRLLPQLMTRAPAGGPGLPHGRRAGILYPRSGAVEAARRYFQLSVSAAITASKRQGDPRPLVERAEPPNGPFSTRSRPRCDLTAVRAKAGLPTYGYNVVLAPFVSRRRGRRLLYIFRLDIQDGLASAHPVASTRRAAPAPRCCLDYGHSPRHFSATAPTVGTYPRFGVRVPDIHSPLISQYDFKRVRNDWPAQAFWGSAQARRSALRHPFCFYCGTR